MLAVLRSSPSGSPVPERVVFRDLYCLPRERLAVP
jgi:hypothetical protein